MKINEPDKKSSEIQNILDKAKIDLSYIKKNKDFRKYILSKISSEQKILDIGKSMREFNEKLKNDKLDTLDINQFKNYPNIQADICEKNLDKSFQTKYDVIICLAVLEHCYNPFEAINNIYNLLEDGGVLYGYVPFLFNYHAPKDLKFFDFFRFSKDGICYLLKDFKDIEIFPVRGKVSTLGNMLLGGYWKKYFEKISLNILVDKLFKDRTNILQTSGFYFIAKK